MPVITRSTRRVRSLGFIALIVVALSSTLYTINARDMPQRRTRQ